MFNRTPTHEIPDTPDEAVYVAAQGEYDALTEERKPELKALLWFLRTTAPNIATNCPELTLIRNETRSNQSETELPHQ